MEVAREQEPIEAGEVAVQPEVKVEEVTGGEDEI
jgi:hypothetical protein